MNGRIRSTFCGVALYTAATLLATPSCAQAQQEGVSRFSFLPQGLLYEPYGAGDKEPRSSASLMARVGGPLFLDAVLGGRVGVVRYGTEGPSGARGIELGVEGAAFPRLNLSRISEAVESVDFRFGFPLTARSGPVAMKAGYYHLSSHLGDEFMDRNPGAVRKNYVKDAATTGLSYDAASWLSVYGEVGYAFYTSGGAEPWEIQVGGEYHPRLVGCWCGAPFLAVHGHLREEVDYGGSLNVTVGSEWRGRDDDRRLGLGFRYFDGYSSQYQFFDEHEALIGLTFWLDI